jgi:acetoin utilization protein AcuC
VPKSNNLVITHGETYLNWQLGTGDGSHPTNPVRAKLATEKLVAQLGDRVQVIDPADPCFDALIALDRAQLEQLHDPAYVARVLDDHCSGEWHGARPAVAKAAFDMFRATMRCVEMIVAGEAKVAFNPMGAKHHAKREHSSGFNVFNDMAAAAIEFKKAGLRPLYLDWDIHAGDGVYHMLKQTGIPRISIHNGSTFPFDLSMSGSRDAQVNEHGWYTKHHETDHAYNFNIESEDGDDALAWAIAGAEEIIERYQPDVILLAAGADGHNGVNNLQLSNRYSYAGFDAAAEMVARQAAKHSRGRVLIGGAGGYQPFDHTPEIWARVVDIIYRASE